MKHSIITQRIFAIVSIIGILSSCGYDTYMYTYSYKKSGYLPNYSRAKDGYEAKQLGEYVVVHVGDEKWLLQNPIKVENHQLVGKIGEVDSQRESIYDEIYMNNGTSYSSDTYTVNQTHIYLKSFSRLADSYIQFDPTKVIAAHYVRMDNRKKARRVGGIVAASVGGALGGMALFLVIACGCPHNYTFDGNQFSYSNTLFTGASAQNLERFDYKKLDDLFEDQSTYEMILKNELNESQFINQLELIVVNHDKNISVVSDQQGNLYSIKEANAPISVMNANNEDVKELVITKDEQSYSFNEMTDENMVNLYATFDKPTDISNAKMVIDLKNTQWGGLVYQEFGNIMGDRFDDWVAKNQERSPEQARKEQKEAGIQLIPYIKKDNTWIELDAIDLIGEVNYNSLVVPIPEELIGDDKIEIKLQAGFNFWQVDYLAMDFTQSDELDVQTLSPSLINGVESFSANYDDEKYLELLNTGDSAHIQFMGLNSSGETRTILLKSKGYYLIKDIYAGKPNWKELMRINEPGGLSILSKDIFIEVQKQLGSVPTEEQLEQMGK